MCINVLKFSVGTCFLKVIDKFVVMTVLITEDQFKYDSISFFLIRELYLCKRSVGLSLVV